VFPAALRFLLGGYLLLSRPFSYIHVPGTPVYIGEVVLAIGFAEILRLRRHWRPVISRSAILRLLMVFMGWCAVRFVTSLKEGLGSPVDILRDSSIWYYGAFAFVVASYATYDPRFIHRFMRWFMRIAPWLLLWTPVVMTIGVAKAVHLPGIPLPLNAVKNGDYAVNCGVAVAAIILGFSGREGLTHRYAHVLVVIGLGAILVSGSQNRGGLIAALGEVGAAFWLSPRPRRSATVRATVPVLVAAIAVVVVVNPRFETHRREVSVRQLASNMKSILGKGEGNADQSSTTEWRLDLWKDVLKDSLSPTYRIKGQGFGPNLYLKYRGDNGDPVPLRNPHSTHLDVLARVGIPGFVLWVVLWGGWWTTSIFAAVRHRRAGSWVHRDITLWLSLSVTAYLVNAAFDPALEGPHAGIWLWTFVGLGVAHFRRPAGRRQPSVARRTSESGSVRSTDVVGVGAVRSRYTARRTGR